MMLKSAHLSRVDLNLLVLFHVVYEERHVARAADRLSLTPSAVSHGLGRLRRLLNDPLFLRTPKGVVPTERALALRFSCPAGDALLLLNLEEDQELRPVPEPLLAPAARGDFQLLFSSEDPRYGGSGTGSPYQDGIWRLPARSALVFIAPAGEVNP